MRRLELIVLLIFGCKSLDPITRLDTGLPDLTPDATKDAIAEVAEVTSQDYGLEEDTNTVVVNALPRSCSLTLRFTPPEQASSVSVCGTWNNWGLVSPDPNSPRECDSMTGPNTDGSFTITYPPGKPAAPGEYAYKFCVNKCPGGQGWYMDPSNPLVIHDGEQKIENSKLIVPDCNLPEIVLESVTTDWNAKSFKVTAILYTGVDGSAIDPASIEVEMRGEKLKGPLLDANGQKFLIERKGLKPGKYSLIFRASNAHGPAEPLYVPIWIEERPFQWQDAILYFAMTDRFANGDKSNDNPEKCLDPSSSKANWMGGDFEGLRQKIEEGYFDEIGINAIWISPPNQNPQGCFKGDLDRLYSAYHGYFPVALDQTDPHFGSMDDFVRLIRAAHDHGIRVIVDLVANHVHESSPLWSQHKDWFNQTPVLCNENDNWNQRPLDCWFQSYLPDVDFRNNEAVAAFSDASVEWVLKADVDGFRVDAVKHMWHDFLRTLRYRLDRLVKNNNVSFWLVGETFVGDWGGGTGPSEQLIKSHVSKAELHGQFDFPLYWAIVETIGRGEGDFGKLFETLAGSLEYYGPDAVMSRFIGNHDVPRFISHASGAIADKWGNGSKEQGWSNPPSLPDTSEPFDRMKMAFAFIMTVPGVPLVYYGDEIGMPGAGDPDNRRMMVFDGLTSHQKDLKEVVARLAKMRASHPATRAGQLVNLLVEKDCLAYALTEKDDLVITVLNRGADRTVSLNLTILGTTSGIYVEVLSNKTIQAQEGKLDITVNRYGVAILVRQ